MDEKALLSLAVISSLVTCGLLISVWVILLTAYFLIKAFSRPKPKREPVTILPSNEFASDWEFVIREVTK